MSKAPGWTEFETLDSVSECWPVTHETSVELWSRLKEDPRAEEEKANGYGSLFEWNLGSPNLLSKHWYKLSREAREDIKRAKKEVDA